MIRQHLDGTRVVDLHCRAFSVGGRMMFGSRPPRHSQFLLREECRVNVAKSASKMPVGGSKSGSRNGAVKVKKTLSPKTSARKPSATSIVVKRPVSASAKAAFKPLASKTASRKPEKATLARVKAPVEAVKQAKIQKTAPSIKISPSIPSAKAVHPQRSSRSLSLPNRSPRRFPPMVSRERTRQGIIVATWSIFAICCSPNAGSCLAT